MTTETLTEAPIYTIQTTGPYAIPHAWSRDADLVVDVRAPDGSTLRLAQGDWSVAPAAPDDSGDLTLTAPAAALHHGKELVITRETLVEQGWAGQAAREKGLEREIDRSARAVQDLRALTERMPRLPRGAAPARPQMPAPEADRVLVGRQDGAGWEHGPNVDEVANAQGYAQAAEGARDRAREWAESPEDVQVEPGHFSALHYAEKARQEARSVQYPVSYGIAQGLTGPEKAQAQANIGLMPQSHPLDNAAGRVLMTGAFGAGTAVTLTDVDDCDLILHFGFYAHTRDAAPLNTPMAEAGMLFVYRGLPTNFVRQVWINRDGPEIFTRFSTDSSSYSPWTRILDTSHILGNSFTVTVGAGGDFPSISAALTSLTENVVALRYKRSGISVTVRLLSGFVLQEQIVCRNGLDLSWITLTSDDAVVDIDASSINTRMYSAVDEGAGHPFAFYAFRNSALPKFQVLFQYATRQTGGLGRGGVLVAEDSKVIFAPGSGVKNAFDGLKVIYGSEAQCHIDGLTAGIKPQTSGVDFSGAGNRAFQAQYGSRASLPRSNFSGAGGDYAVYVIWGSSVDIYQSKVEDAEGTAVACRDGSVMNAREVNAKNAGNHGFYCIHGSTMNARQDPLSWAGGDGANGATKNGVHCGEGSSIACSGMTAKNCGDAGFRALEGGRISCPYGDASGSTIGFRCTEGSIISAEGSTGSTNITPNSIQADGIIFR